MRSSWLAPGLRCARTGGPRMRGDVREVRESDAPLRTEGDSWDVGYAALYLASDESRWVNGITLPVDAGLTAISPVTYQTLGQQQYAQPS